MGGKGNKSGNSRGVGVSKILPFILGLFLFGLAGWLFLPALLQSNAVLPVEAQKPSQAVAESMRQNLPDHVFFSAQAHSRDTCNQCHGFSTEEYLAIFKMRAITDGQISNEKGTEKDPEKATVFYQADPMSMAQCESCHAIPAHVKSTTAGTACDTCHK